MSNQTNRAHVIQQCTRLQNLGISYEDAVALRRIAMTLHNWYEMECGDEWGRCIERDEKTGKPFQYNHNWHFGKRYPTPDREAGAIKRLQKIMQTYTQANGHTMDLDYYIQTDPRGASLYILKPGDIPEGRSKDEFYTNGIALYK